VEVDGSFAFSSSWYRRCPVSTTSAIFFAIASPMPEARRASVRDEVLDRLGKRLDDLGGAAIGARLERDALEVEESAISCRIRATSSFFIAPRHALRPSGSSTSHAECESVAPPRRERAPRSWALPDTTQAAIDGSILAGSPPQPAAPCSEIDRHLP